MTTTTMTDVDELLADLRRQHAALGEPGDVLNTDNAHARYWGRRSALEGCMRVLDASRRTLAEVEPQIAEQEAWLEFLTRSRQTLGDDLAAIDPAARDNKTLGRADALKLSIRQIDRGIDFRNELCPVWLPLDDLLREAGYQDAGTLASTVGAAWRGSLPRVNHRLAELRKRRDQTRGALNAARREAEALLANPIGDGGTS